MSDTLMAVDLLSILPLRHTNRCRYGSDSPFCNTTSCCTNPGPWIARPLLFLLSEVLPSFQISISKYGVIQHGALILLSTVRMSIEPELPISFLQPRNDLRHYAADFLHLDFRIPPWLWTTTRMMHNCITYLSKYVKAFI